MNNLLQLFKMYKDKISPEKSEKDKVWSKIDTKINKDKKRIFSFNTKWQGLFTVLILFGLISLTYLGFSGKDIDIFNPNKEDDWQYEVPSGGSDFSLSNFFGTQNKPMMEMASEDSVGYSTGGAKDVNNFRENIENGYLPLPTDITYEGLFYEYFFDRGQVEDCTELFCPSYATAISNDPISDEKQYFMTVGLNSNIKESDFQRKKLNLVIVLDISGSMSSPFSSYYYDQFGNMQEIEIDEEDKDKSKQQIANEAIVNLTRHLNDEDRFGVVLFDDESYLGKPLSLVKDTDMDAIRDHILELTPQGGTNMEAGYEEGTELFEEYLEVDQSEYENRIIFLTDAMPNAGVTSEEGLLGMTESNAENKVYTTFVGIGVDFNTELVEDITKVKGANYYSVHSSEEFKERMDEGFDYMVTPLVFDLELKLAAQGFEIEKVYGSPEADEATGQIMKVNTLFPSKTEGGETKGGIVLLQLKKTREEANLNLSVSYKDREGQDFSSSKIIEFDNNAEHFDNNGIRKGILLARYVNLMKNWIIDERETIELDDGKYYVNEESGLCIPPEVELGEWERQSVDLQVSDHYKDLFDEFKEYLEDEISNLEDETLNQEVELLEALIDY